MIAYSKRLDEFILIKKENSASKKWVTNIFHRSRKSYKHASFRPYRNCLNTGEAGYNTKFFLGVIGVISIIFKYLVL